MRRLLPAASLVLLAAIIFRVQTRMDVLRHALPPGYEMLYLPAGKYIKLTSLGYQQIFADVIYLWSIQHTTNEAVPDRFARVEHVYEVINDLDPEYVDPYHIGAMTMVYEMNNIPMALRLLDRGMRNLPANWSIPMDAGFYAFMHARDFDLAVHYFDIAMQRPGAPSVLRRLRADMYRRKGDIQTARDFWHDVLEGTTDERERRIAYNHFFDLSQETDLRVLRKAIEAYTTARGHRPARLSRLKEDGFIAEVPTNPEGAEYIYDPRSGEVSPPSPFNLNRRVQ
ncbi:MAG: hypothetical protein HYX75_03955 [Acidobacteria bacterium]|nr:hypothetical protein [Acidobacteriota bacterium]